MSMSVKMSHNEKKASNVSLGEHEKQKCLSDLHVFVCVNRRKMEVLCITTTLLKQDKKHIHRSLPVRAQRTLCWSVTFV